MKKLSHISLLAAITAAAAMWSGTAMAAHVSVGIYGGVPAPYYAPPPVVYAPRPYYYVPPPEVVVAPGWERTEWRDRDWREHRAWREREWSDREWHRGRGDHHHGDR